MVAYQFSTDNTDDTMSEVGESVALGENFFTCGCKGSKRILYHPQLKRLSEQWQFHAQREQFFLYMLCTVSQSAGDIPA